MSISTVMNKSAKQMIKLYNDNVWLTKERQRNKYNIGDRKKNNIDTFDDKVCDPKIMYDKKSI